MTRDIRFLCSDRGHRRPDHHHLRAPFLSPAGGCSPVGQRTWTDEQLRVAVAGQRSWRGVLRALGLVATSGGSIGTVRRRADKLGLDSSHFTGARRWSDEDLIAAIEHSLSWTEVAETLGLIKERRTGLRLKGDALRLGLEVADLDHTPQAQPSFHFSLAIPTSGLSDMRRH